MAVGYYTTRHERTHNAMTTTATTSVTTQTDATPSTITSPSPSPTPLCRHCRIARVNRPRGLCWSCYHTPGVRDRYATASTSRYSGIDAVPDRHGRTPLPDAPTTARPGTADKVAVLAARAAAGVSLWHPGDATW